MPVTFIWNSRDLSVSKTAQIDYETNIIYYTIEVRSTKGENTIVYVEDTVEGTALTLDQDSINIVTSNVTPVAHRHSDNYFNYSIHSLPEGEYATITYQAKLDTTKITGKGTKEETNNLVSVTTLDKCLEVGV